MRSSRWLECFEWFGEFDGCGFFLTDVDAFEEGLVGEAFGVVV